MVITPAARNSNPLRTCLYFALRTLLVKAEEHMCGGDGKAAIATTRRADRIKRTPKAALSSFGDSHQEALIELFKLANEWARTKGR